MTAAASHAALVEATRTELRDRPDASPAEVVERHLRRAQPLLDRTRFEQLRGAVLAELVGLGPLERWLADPAVSEVMVNRGTELWVDRHGRPEHVGQLALGQLEGLIERIISPLGLRLDRSTPIVDARLADGSRLCAVLPPIAPDGPCCSIRRFRPLPLTLADFTSDAVGELLGELIERRCNVLVSGPTSSGKTSLLNVLASIIDPGERLITIEDTAELRLAHHHVVRLEARRQRHEATGPVDIGDLLRTALRLRPDRLIVGEVRGAEAVDMVQAMNTGHDGSLSTCHANSTEDALRRVESMVLIGAPSWPLTAVREQVHSSIDVVIQLGRDDSGRRTIVAVAEVLEPACLGRSIERVRPLAVAGRRVGNLDRGRR